MLITIGRKVLFSTTGLIYGALLFIALFTYFFPVSLPGLPVTTDRLLQLAGIAYFVFVLKGRLPRPLALFLLYSFVILVAISVSLVLNGSTDDQTVKQALSSMMYVFGALVITACLRKIAGQDAFGTLLKWTLIVAAVQAALSLFLFFNKELQASVIAFIGGDMGDHMLHFSAVRLIAIAKGQMQYGNMAVFYGIASFITMLWMGRTSSIVPKILFFLFFVAGILSARSYLLVLGVGLFVLFLLNAKKKGIARSIYYCMIGLFILVAITIAGMKYLENSEYKETYEWAFEVFLNMAENGSLEAESTEVMKSMYVFPEKASTWIIGDGRLANPDDTFYMHTDIGYLRYLYCCGIIGSLLIYYAQIRYCRIASALTDNRDYKYLFGFILLWAFIYLTKEIYNTAQWMTLFTAALCVDKEHKNPLSCPKSIS
ncbi:MAG: hypothetical protein K2N04_05795 [Alistipes sp.]|nr:hypothetical protein [Alistipes sp.]